ncbi:MAG: hypothetical protein R2706_16635 [Acidimicrobiales bacterium]
MSSTIAPPATNGPSTTPRSQTLRIKHLPNRARQRHVLGRVVTVVALLAASVVTATVGTTVASVVAPTPARAAASGPTVTVTGRGWGHGRGMGQYGAYGYAKDDGWSSAQILDHYYGGTVAGTIPAGTAINPSAVRVELREERDRPVTVGLASGTISLLSEAGDSLGSISTGYLRLTRTAEGYLLESGTACGGPWTEEALYTATTVRLVPVTTSIGASGSLHLCEANGVTWYGGEIKAVYYGGVSRVVNVVALETYLRGVVPARFLRHGHGPLWKCRRLRPVPTSWPAIPASSPTPIAAIRRFARCMTGSTRVKRRPRRRQSAAQRPMLRSPPPPTSYGSRTARLLAPSSRRARVATRRAGPLPPCPTTATMSVRIPTTVGRPLSI